MATAEKPSKTIAPLLYAAAAGLLFAFGLVFSGMAQPAKVLAFLNIGALANGVDWQATPGLWDPSLALVMGGALAVTLPAFWLTPKHTHASGKPWAADAFDVPSKTQIDKPLLIGAALFGAGWALAGYCPGPAMASVLFSSDAALFAVAMMVGMRLVSGLDQSRH